MKRKLLCALAALLTVKILSAVELVPTQELLASYLEQDADLKNLALELQKAKLNQQSTLIDKGISIKLQTGDMTFTFGDKSSFSVKPGVSATIPQANNLGLNLNSQLSVADGKTSFDSASATVSVDVISSNKANRDISLLQQERKVLEAERNLTNKALDKEKNFYKSLSNLMNSVTSVLSKKSTVFDDNVSFEKIKLQGYSADSASYIKAELKLFTSQRDYEEAVHSLINDYKSFYISCGREIEIPEDADFTQLIPTDITLVEAVDITSFDKSKYKDIESNEWNQTINQMSRDASTKLTLTANGGYSYRNNNGKASNSVNAGISGSYEGINLSASVSVPIADEKSSPSVTVGLSWSPNTAKKNKISEQLEEISIEQEQMKLDSAYSSYETTVQERQLKLADLMWNIQSNQTNLEMYEKVEANMKSYYDRGLISEKDYSSACNSTIQAKVKQISGYIDLIIYNNEVSAMFVE
ncbi:MAG: TolC family protein [Treponema sp.]|nr:TolC family protein [Treponema sp.]